MMRSMMVCVFCSTLFSFAEVSAQAPRPWTFDEVKERWQQSPRDPYLQYLLVQLARRDNRLTEVQESLPWQANGGATRRRAVQADIWSLFSGGLAVQESLQLDALGVGDNPNVPPPLPTLPGLQPVNPPEPRFQGRDKVPLTELKGPTVQSHPWDKMLAGRKPTIDPLALMVPEDFWFAQFRSASRMMEVLDTAGLFGNHLFTQALGDSTSYGTAQRLRKQLAFVDDQALRPIYDTLVREIALTGSDLYLNEGSDVTVLMLATKPKALQVPLRLLFDKAQRDNPDAKRAEGEYLGVAYQGLVTPDRSLSVYVADPTPEVHVRSNSLVALRRVLAAMQGKEPKRLGEAKEFAYMRTLMPRGAAEEDGFVYLSDPFIRRMVGPTVRLAERRRQIALSHLRMIGHGALMFQTEFGRPPKSFAELVEKRCAPGIFGKDRLACPSGGDYALSADGLMGTSSLYNTPTFLTPLIELPITHASGDEARDYTAFVEEYSQYWRTYFDPIALRIQATDTTYRLETIILPLIDNSVYTTLAEAVGGKVISLDQLPVSSRNIGSVGFKINKQGLSDMLSEGKAAPTAQLPSVQSINNLKMIGLAMHNYADANAALPAVAPIGGKKNRGLSWRVHLLPYLEQETLYREFNLDEPWDSEHNRKLIAKMPKVYISPRANPKFAKEGKTVYLVPVHPNSMFSPKFDPITFAAVSDGLSNTIMTLEANDDAAAIWTKPDDLVIDLKNPLKGLNRNGPIHVGMGDGTVQTLDADIDARVVAVAITRNDGQFLPIPPSGGSRRNEPPIVRFLRDFAQNVPSGIEPQKFAEFMLKGLGEQVVLSLHDSQRVLDLDWTGAFSSSAGPLFGIAPILHLITCPVSIAIPVQDAKIVDQFLKLIDDMIAKEIRPQDPLTGMGGQDFYTFQLPGGHTIRAYSLSFGGLKWRLFWGRIGNGFYLVNRPQLLAELAEAQSRPASERVPVTGHLMLKIRPAQWKEVLAGYELGWAENARQASRENLSRLTHIVRAFPADVRPDGRIGELDEQRVFRIYGMRPFCPEGGTYSVGSDGQDVISSIHGDRLHPRQPNAPTDRSPTGKLMRSLTDVTAVLTFTDDGLRAVVTIQRK